MLKLPLPICLPLTRRLAIMRLCCSWQDAVLAAPELVPAMIALTLPPQEVTRLGQYHCHDLHESVHIRVAHDNDVLVLSTIALLGQAAGVQPLAWSVQLEGLDDQVGTAAAGCCRLLCG
jgi:hypothetical protein